MQKGAKHPFWQKLSPEERKERMLEINFKRPRVQAPLCKCGCGRPVSKSSNGCYRAGWVNGHFKHPGPSKEQLDAARAKRDDLTFRKISLAITGTHGFGRGAKDAPNHAKAHHWILRSPLGTIYEFDNLQSWARKNESLFLPDDYPDATLPLWKRFVSGINNQQRKDKKATTSWRGWTMVSNIEQKQMGCPDLLNRKTLLA
jgi:hypothetical protein